MSITFFLLPKNEVIYLALNSTIRQAMEKMEHHRYTAIPLVDEEGKYVGTITEGDLLWKLKNCDMNFKDTEKIRLTDVPRHINNIPAKITASLEDLLSMAMNQNFIPVIDDNGIFIGIIRRREIIECCANLLYDMKFMPKDHQGIFDLIDGNFSCKQ